MKPIKKKFAKLYIAILAIVLVAASVFSFVIMPWGEFGTYNSFIGDQKFAGDMQGGFYAEYKIESGNTETKINNAAEKISEIANSQLSSSGSCLNNKYSKTWRVKMMNVSVTMMLLPSRCIRR